MYLLLIGNATEGAEMTSTIMPQTAHFETRMRQRGIRKEVVNTVLEYGRCNRVGGADSTTWTGHRGCERALS